MRCRGYHAVYMRQKMCGQVEALDERLWTDYLICLCSTSVFKNLASTASFTLYNQPRDASFSC